eukprot:COSAG04_NODE_878_length_9680_cov_2.690951_3_plen_181_part_00
MYPVRKIPGKEHLGALTSIVDDAEATVSARLTTVLVDSYSFPYICSPLPAFAQLMLDLGSFGPALALFPTRLACFLRCPLPSAIQVRFMSPSRDPDRLFSLDGRREHCRALQSFLLLKQGDFIQSLMTLVAEELAKPAVRPSFFFLNCSLLVEDSGSGIRCFAGPEFLSVLAGLLAFCAA